MRTADTVILEQALEHAYSLLNSVAEKNGTLPKSLVTEIRKILPPRFPMSFSAKTAATVGTHSNSRVTLTRLEAS